MNRQEQYKKLQELLADARAKIAEASVYANTHLLEETEGFKQLWLVADDANAAHYAQWNGSHEWNDSGCEYDPRDFD